MARKQNPVIVSSAGAAPARRKSASSQRIARPAAVEIVDAGTVASTERFEDAVARLAYSYWEARGYADGSPEADWLRAEQELRATLSVK